MASLEDCRRFYAEEIRFAANLHTPALAEAFARVPRENFLGPPPWNVGSPEGRALSLAGMKGGEYVTTSDPRDLYHNLVVVVDEAANLNNGQPSALARWIDALELKAGDRAFHLGSGVGYYTAIMAETVGQFGSIVASEVRPDLAARAEQNLAAWPQVTVHAGDGAIIDPGECDAMLINAGVTHPQSLWLDRLRPGGRIVLPLTVSAGAGSHGQGVMTLITRESTGYSARIVTFVAIYSCTSIRDPAREALLMKALTSRTFLKMKSIRRDAHEATETCLVHGSDVLPQRRPSAAACSVATPGCALVPHTTSHAPARQPDTLRVAPASRPAFFTG